MSQTAREELDDEGSEGSEMQYFTAIPPQSPTLLDVTQFTVSTVSVNTVNDVLFNMEQNLDRLLNYRAGLIGEYQDARVAFNPVTKLCGIRLFSAMNLLKSLTLLYWFFMVTRIIVRFDLCLYMALIGSMSIFLMSFGLASEHSLFTIPMIISLILELLTGVRQGYYTIEIIQDPERSRLSDYVGLFGTVLLADASTYVGLIRFTSYVLIKTLWLLFALGHFMSMFFLMREKSQTLRNLEEKIRQAQRDILAASTQIDNLRMQNRLNRGD
ncbi:unnamed protein product [Bursaphelenchus xylophilus]|uniref:(pine wood nematode) hypothetical protein n=1 Tax=Bursaphelenchus xylophilus TaxID=6326 RepID=A0A1I7RQU5_BURXY|nr:unnamed protein product [Bursaphelenchus xylophilus]CAG9130675.1 unnamed protein product [Bursaphelenchus xylophilus]